MPLLLWGAGREAAARTSSSLDCNMPTSLRSSRIIVCCSTASCKARLAANSSRILSDFSSAGQRVSASLADPPAIVAAFSRCRHCLPPDWRSSSCDCSCSKDSLTGKLDPLLLLSLLLLLLLSEEEEEFKTSSCLLASSSSSLALDLFSSSSFRNISQSSCGLPEALPRLLLERARRTTLNQADHCFTSAALAFEASTSARACAREAREVSTLACCRLDSSRTSAASAAASCRASSRL
mmetsp:Transcript_67115/g.120858  ORF Transcript_67115/g.120858 Transcript_67115/m.120858 type:complete len:238 (-) Transcript_67115:189-902(-)